jgi:2-polyprenyl-3-methyl-5-hydroxy-6-metoxy-1,4-benzoquinol methylase
VRCLHCELTFAGLKPGDDELRAHYGNYGTAWHDSPITRQRYGELLDTFEPYRETNRILDIGCGAGFFLEEAQRRGWEAYGSEFSTRALGINRARALNVVPAPISDETFAAQSFDVVTAFEVVEHFRDPADEAAVFAHVLRLGGLFYCTTPNFGAATRRLLGPRWCNIAYPEHLFYFTTSTLASWLAPFGFVATSIHTTGFSPTALRKSLAPGSHPTAPGQTGDERLRIAVERSRLLVATKHIVDRALSSVGAGDTLKAWFELR